MKIFWYVYIISSMLILPLIIITQVSNNSKVNAILVLATIACCVISLVGCLTEAIRNKSKGGNK